MPGSAGGSAEWGHKKQVYLKNRAPFVKCLITKQPFICKKLEDDLSVDNKEIYESRWTPCSWRTISKSTQTICLLGSAFIAVPVNMVYGFLEAVLLLGAKNNGGGGVSITMQNILNEKNKSN